MLRAMLLWSGTLLPWCLPLSMPGIARLCRVGSIQMSSPDCPNGEPNLPASAQIPCSPKLQGVLLENNTMNPRS